MAAELRNARSKAKRAVTKDVNQVKQLLAEDETEKLAERVGRLKGIFKEFNEAHDSYHQILETEEDLEASDAYFYKVQEDYITVLNLAKQHITDVKQRFTEESPAKRVSLGGSGSGAEDITRGELLSLLNMPRVELQIFNGDPLHYHQFIKAFEQNVDCICSDSDLKLSRLMQYTSGPAREAIRGCQLVGGDRGMEKQ